MGVYTQIVRTIDNCQLLSDGTPPQKKKAKAPPSSDAPQEERPLLVITT